MKASIVLNLVIIFVCNGNSANILGIFPIASPSHRILGDALFKELTKRGHHVTMLSPYPSKTPVENYTDIYLDGMIEYKERELKQVMSFNSSIWTIISSLASINSYSKVVYESKGLQTLLNSNASFDLIIQVVFSSEALLAIAHHYNVPVIGFSTLGVNEVASCILRSPSEYVYAPGISLPFPDEMTFFQRVANTVIGYLFKIVTYTVLWPAQNRILQQFFPGYPPIEDLVQNVSLVFLNTHYSIESPQPYLPNMIQIGGFHIQDEELPIHLQDYLDSAKNGAVYFSLGSNIKSQDLPADKLNAIFKVLSKFPDKKFLWKFEDDHVKMPKNVKVQKWLPQRGILAHPNIKAFITHGGLLSTTEAIHFGVPLVGIPAFGDQRTNLMGAVNKGYAIKVDLQELNEDNFYKAIHEVLYNPKYRENIKRRSSLLRDTLVKPMDVAIHWVEHVLKYGGAKHLQHAGLKLQLYEYYLLDVVAFLIAVFVLVTVLNYYITKKILNYAKLKVLPRKSKTN